MDLVVYVNSISIKPEGEKKNIDEQPVEETHRAKSGRVLYTGASVSVELDCITH